MTALCPRCAGRVYREPTPEGSDAVCLACGSRTYYDRRGALLRPAPYAPTHEPRPAGQYVPPAAKTVKRRAQAERRDERRAG